MWAFIVSGIGRWVVGGAAIVAIISGIYLKGHSDGKSACETKQQAQMAKVEAYVKRIRERVERNEPLGDDILRSDPFER
jgi:hypothetical protein